MVAELLEVKENPELDERELELLIGGIAETQEVLDFCAEHNIMPETELIPIQDINKAFKQMQDGEVRFRYVIDMQSLKEENE